MSLKILNRPTTFIAEALLNQSNNSKSYGNSIETRNPKNKIVNLLVNIDAPE